MSHAFQSPDPGQPVTRAVQGLSLFGVGTYTQVQEVSIPSPYQASDVSWGLGVAESLPMALAVLAACLSEADGSCGTDPWDLHEQFAEEVISRLDPAAPFSLDWYEVQSWIDKNTLGEHGTAVRCVQRIREFERLLELALDAGDESRPRYAQTSLWRNWDVETLVDLCIVARTPRPEFLARFVDHLLDIKFKLYCLLEVDIPAYATAVSQWGLRIDDPGSTPQGFMARLSEEVTLIIKSRAIWESVMNAVYQYETGRDAPTKKVTDELGVTFNSKTTKFFPWVADQHMWSSLATFEPLVEELDKLRMAEVHRLSRARSNFTNLIMQPIEGSITLLNRILQYVFDHFVAAIALRQVASYNAHEGSVITISLPSQSATLTRSTGLSSRPGDGTPRGHSRNPAAFTRTADDLLLIRGRMASASPTPFLNFPGRGQNIWRSGPPG